MSSNIPTETPAEEQTARKPGFFQRLYEKLDAKMKAKAEAAEDCCCCEDNEKGSGSKCC